MSGTLSWQVSSITCQGTSEGKIWMVEDMICVQNGSYKTVYICVTKMQSGVVVDSLES